MQETCDEYLLDKRFYGFALHEVIKNRVNNTIDLENLERK